MLTICCTKDLHQTPFSPYSHFMYFLRLKHFCHSIHYVTRYSMFLIPFAPLFTLGKLIDDAYNPYRVIILEE